MHKVAILGGSGYAGSGLIRILLKHPEVKITAVTSEKSSGKSVSDLFPFLRTCGNLIYEPAFKDKLLKKADVFFLALPHAAAMEAGDFFVRHGKKVIDLSADYRLKNPSVYAEWYKIEHKYQSTLKKAVYGLPEIYRAKIARASLVANPGCYPTSAILGLYPLFKNKLVELSPVVIDSKSGTSGAGRKSDVNFSFCEVNEGFKAYGIASHRHTPEIEQELSAAVKGDVVVDFTPHLLPVDRGILSTMYVKPKKEIKNLHEIYKKTYEKEPFIYIHDEGKFPNLKNVRGTNMCEIGLKYNKRTGFIIVVSAIDNLVKGASGQAVHNMNIMLGIEETTALETLSIHP